MNKLVGIGLLISSLALFTLSGCGGGGGGTGSGTTTLQPTTAVLKLSTQGALPQGSSIAGIGVTVNIPQGVTVKTDASRAVLNTVAVPSGVAAQATITPPIYTPATSSASGKLSFVLASTQANGFSAGEFVTVNCDGPAGTLPKATDFSLTDFKPVGLNGAAIAGLSTTFTADIK